MTYYKFNPLIGWNYSIQTGENISTNGITQIYNRSHGFYKPGLYLNLTDDRDLGYCIQYFNLTFLTKQDWNAIKSLFRVIDLFSVYNQKNSVPFVTNSFCAQGQGQWLKAKSLENISWNHISKLKCDLIKVLTTLCSYLPCFLPCYCLLPGHLLSMFSYVNRGHHFTKPWHWQDGAKYVYLMATTWTHWSEIIFEGTFSLFWSLDLLEAIQGITLFQTFHLPFAQLCSISSCFYFKSWYV